MKHFVSQALGVAVLTLAVGGAVAHAEGGGPDAGAPAEPKPAAAGPSYQPGRLWIGAGSANAGDMGKGYGSRSITSGRGTGSVGTVGPPPAKAKSGDDAKPAGESSPSK